MGAYVCKPGSPETSVLLPGFSTEPDGIGDVESVYASVFCNNTGDCEHSAAVGEPSTGSVWIEHFPIDFWSPATHGTFVEKVEREIRFPDGEAPYPTGVIIGLEGFPPEEASKLHVGPNGSFVWGLIEVTGTFSDGMISKSRWRTARC